MTEIKTVGVIGAGQMGSGIAHVCALAGYQVLLNDVSPDQIDKGLETVRRYLERQVAKGQVSQSDMDGVLSRVKAAPDYPSLADADIVIEAATENEAIYALYEGVGTVEAIDVSMRLGANHPMGPLELGDYIGLDTVLAIMNMLHEGLADSKYRPCPLLVKYVEAGWLGRKTNRGFYDYRGEKPVPTR